MRPDPLLGRSPLRQALAWAGAALMLAPLGWMLATSLKSYEEILRPGAPLLPETPRWQNYPEALGAFPFARCFANSLLLSLLVVAGTLLSTSLAAYAFAWLGGRWRRRMFALMLGAMLVPAQVAAIPLFRRFAGWGWIDTWLPIAAPAWMGTNLFALFLLRQAFAAIPRDLIDAARADGAGTFSAFWHVALPSARPALCAVAALSFMASWNDLWGPLVYLNDERLQTLPVGLVASLGSAARPEGLPWHLYMAASAVLVAPVLLVFLAAQSAGLLDSAWRRQPAPATSPLPRRRPGPGNRPLSSRAAP
jgi:ABC-type glycerol-3-phosphate transport system permease component